MFYVSLLRGQFKNKDLTTNASCMIKKHLRGQFHEMFNLSVYQTVSLEPQNGTYIIPTDFNLFANLWRYSNKKI